MEVGGVVLVVHQLTQEANKHQSTEALVVEEALQVYFSFKSVISVCGKRGKFMRILL
jgi:hypothetical protein